MFARLWKVNSNTCANQVYNAIKSGYRLFDGACGPSKLANFFRAHFTFQPTLIFLPDYGDEQESGLGVARAIKEGIVKRSDLFIVTKLWNAFHDKKHVGPICKKQLQDWGIDYFDLYLIHFPISLKYVDPSVRYPPGWASDDGKTVIPGRATI